MIIADSFDYSARIVFLTRDFKTLFFNLIKLAHFTDKRMRARIGFEPSCSFHAETAK